MSTQQAIHVVKKLSHLANSASQKPLKDSPANFPARDTNHGGNCKNWHEWRQPLTRGVSPEGNKTTTNRAKATRGGTGIRRKTGGSDEKDHHKENDNIFTIFESPHSQSGGDEVSNVSQIQLGQADRHKNSEDLKNNKTTSQAQQRQQQGPRFDFKLPDLPSVLEDEIERASTDTTQKHTHTYENTHHHHHHQQHQHLSLETTSESLSYHHLNECPFYTSEVSNLKLRILELEYINATLENKVHKYRDEIRLFKKDIKGYKIDGKQFTQMLKERENEISILHQKITQLLNRDSLPSPPSSIKSPVNTSSSSSNGSGSGSGSIYKSYRPPSNSARSHSSGPNAAGKYRRTLEHIEEAQEAQSDLEEQTWI